MISVETHQDGECTVTWRMGADEARYLADFVRARNGSADADALEAAADRMDPRASFVEEGWWHPNVKDGRVHDHPQHPNGGWSSASHRLCEPVYTKRTAP